jgi:adenylate cyclase, class 2
MQAAETELKFLVPDQTALRSRALAQGFALQTERTFESNTLYDTPERLLRGKKQILRLRFYGDRCTLTHKRMVEGATDEGARHNTRVETETLVEDCEAMAEVFVQLGYSPVFRYEKYRTEWSHGEGHLVVDETPIGVWAELEGPPDWIDNMLEKLEVPQEACTTESYGALFLIWKDRTGSPAENLTFEEVEELALR